MSTLKTNNQQYGSHYGRSSSMSKQKIGRSTLDFLKKNDYKEFLHQQQNIAQRSRHGLFTQPIPLGTGDLYMDKKPQPVPVNVKVNGRMQQKVGPQLFQKMGSTNLGDLYKDKFRQQQLYTQEKNALSIHNQAFNAGGAQKLVKHSQFQHNKQFDDKIYETRDETGKVKTGLKKIYTSNMKRGNGNTTVGHLFGAFKYEYNPYDDGHDMQKNQRLIHKSKIPVPFSGASSTQQTFTPHHQIFHNQPQPYVAQNQDNQFRNKTSQKWNYNNPNKKGFNGTFTKFPIYVEQGDKQKDQKKEEPIWKPNFNGTSKGLGETLARPCPPTSQVMLNQIRRNK